MSVIYSLALPFDKGTTLECSEEGRALGWQDTRSVTAPLVPWQPNDLLWSPPG